MTKQERIEQLALETYPVHYSVVDKVYGVIPEDINEEARAIWIQGYWTSINNEEWKELYAEGLQMGNHMSQQISGDGYVQWLIDNGYI